MACHLVRDVLNPADACVIRLVESYAETTVVVVVVHVDVMFA